MHNENNEAVAIENQTITDGSLVEVYGRRLHIRLIGDNVVLHDFATHDERTCGIDDLREMIDTGNAQLLPPGSQPHSSVPAHFDANNAYRISDVPESLRSPAAVEKWLEKIKWLQRIKDKGYKTFQDDKELLLTLREIEHEYVEKCPFETSTLYKAHLNVRKKDGDYRSIFPQFSNRGGKGKSRLPEAIDKIIDEEMEAAKNPAFGLLKPARIYESIEGRVLQLQRAEPHERYSIPSLPTITRRMNEQFSAYEIYLRKHGRERAMRQFRQHGMRIRANRPLDIVEFDDKDTACFLIDERTQLPWGRAYITAGVDQSTSSVLGINISEHARSTQSAWAAFEHAIYPKDPSHPDFADCVHKWEPYGHIGTVLLDNATYNSTSAFQASILEYGGEVEYSRPHQPTNKSGIEHFNHVVVADHISHKPGWAGEKEDRDALDHGLTSAVYSLGEFKRDLMAWITDVYSNKTILALGMSPREAWAEGFLHMPPHLPRKMPPIALAGTIRQTLKKRDSGGLLRKQLRYQSEELHELMGRMGSKVEYVVRYAPHDLSYLMVEDPRTNSYLRVPCIEDPQKYQFITDYQHSLILKFCAASRKKGTKAIDLYEGRKRLIENTKQQLESKSMRMRKAAVRAGAIPEIENPEEKKAKMQPPPMSKIERFVMEIADYELEGEDFEFEFTN